MAEGSEFCLEIAEVSCNNLDLNGSLIVHALSVAGHIQDTNKSVQSENINQPMALPQLASDVCTSEETIAFSEKCGRILLEDVTVVNKGIDWSHPENVFWQHKVGRKEAMIVFLRGRSEFDARGVTLAGDCVFDVPDGYKMEVRQGSNGEIVKKLKPLTKIEWRWRYHLSAEDSVSLTWEET